MTWRSVRPWVGAAGRLGLGGVWLAAGLSKIGDLAASGRAVVAYRLLPPHVAVGLGSVLPFVEIAVGLLLVLGLATRVAAAASGLLLTAYVMGVASVWMRGLRIDCGCFGGGGDLTGDARPQYLGELIRDIALLFVAGFLVLWPRTRISLDSWALGTGDAPRAKGTRA